MSTYPGHLHHIDTSAAAPPTSIYEQDGRDRLLAVTERFRDQLRSEGYNGDLSAIRLNDETFDHIANRFSMAMDERDIHLAELDATATLQAIALQYRSESSPSDVDRSPSEIGTAAPSDPEPDPAPVVRQAYRAATYDDPASEASILDALARARGVHLGRLRPGRSPEGVPLTQDSAIVHALLLDWGLHQQADTTYRHVRKAVASARADAEFAESWGDPPRSPEPEIVEGTTPIVF